MNSSTRTADTDTTHFHRKDWHSSSAETILDFLGTNASTGLPARAAVERLDTLGPNLLPEKKKTSVIIRFLKHFNDVLIYVLFAAALITLALGHYIDTVVILVVTVINALIGFFQENKAEKALEDIKKMLSAKAQVIRDGKQLEIDAATLVAGDVVLLNPGDKVPADLRLLATSNLKIEEAPLTGESVPVEKNTATLPADTMLGDRVNMAFSGMTVRAGTGRGVVVATGARTEIGKISQMMSDVAPLNTPLLKQTAQFGKTVSVIILAGSALIYLFGHFFRHYPTSDLLLSVIGLAIAAIPEGLPAILSIILAIGVQSLAKRNAITRTLPSVETLGSVSVICSDKTGTLTKNEMTVQTLETRDGEFEVTGTGYAPTGEILSGGKKTDMANEPVLAELIRCFRICNEASLVHEQDGTWTIVGDPTEGALVTLFEKAAVDHTPPARISTIPFDSQYKYMATLVAGAEGETRNLILIKGAPDKLLGMAQTEKTAAGEKKFERQYWDDKITALALRGQRVLGAACKLVDKTQTTITHDDIQGGIVFLGLAGIIDPPRDESIEAVRKCKDAGITVKMITGDHADTARTIAKQLGIGDGTRAIQGRELEQMSPAEMEEAAAGCDVFARTSPEHKLKLVEALQARGTICAMTGDGVNDAPALKKADIGIAMGIKGTDVTKDAAEIVLADDNFSTIVAAVEEGRRVYDNLKKTILFILPTNGAESFLIMASILFGTMLPLTPLQILWVNMVTSVTISLALAFERVEPGAMRRPPRPASTPLLDGYFIWRILFVSVLIGGCTLWLSQYLYEKSHSETLVRTVVLQTIVMGQAFHLFNSRSIRGNAFKYGLFDNKAIIVVWLLMLVLQSAITYLPFMNAAFGTTPLEPGYWKYPVMLGVLVFLVVEIEKAIMRQIDKRRGRG